MPAGSNALRQLGGREEGYAREPYQRRLSEAYEQEQDLNTGLMYVFISLVQDISQTQLFRNPKVKI